MEREDYTVRPNSSNSKRDSDGLFDRRVCPIDTMQEKRFGREKWRLCKKPRVGALMLLSGMHQERMAQVDRACVSCRRDLAPTGDFSKAFLGGQLSRRQAVLAQRSQNPCDIKMRTHANARRSVTLADIREKKQHQQGSSFRNYVDAPIQKITGSAPIGWETAVNVPACVSGIVRRRKTNGERSEIGASTPSAWADKLIECLVQDSSIRGRGKWFLCIHA